MEVKLTNEDAQARKLLFFCLRAVLMCACSLLLTVNTGIYEQGITKSTLNAFVIIVAMMYRLLCVTFVPAALVKWFFRRSSRKEGENAV